MAITYNDAVKTSRLGAVNTALASGFLDIYTSAYGTLLAHIPLAATAGTVSGAGTVILTLNAAGMTIAAAATGTAAIARLVSSTSVAVASGLTVGTSATDVILNNLSIATAQTVTVSSAVITHG